MDNLNDVESHTGYSAPSIANTPSTNSSNGSLLVAKRSKASPTRATSTGHGMVAQATVIDLEAPQIVEVVEIDDDDDDANVGRAHPSRKVIPQTSRRPRKTNAEEPGKPGSRQKSSEAQPEGKSPHFKKQAASRQPT